MGGGVRKAGFKGSGGVELSFSGFCKIAACVNSGVMLKGLRGVENAAVAVEEPCVLGVHGVNHLIIKHDQIPFAHVKIGILLQSRRNSLDEFNVWHGD